MTTLFYASGAIAVIAAVMVVTRINAMHALLHLILLFLAIASIYFSLGASFAAVLQIVVYAGAIIVLFVFVIMLLNLGREAEQQERKRLSAAMWILPAVLAACLLAMIVYALAGAQAAPATSEVGPKAVGKSLFITYVIGVELASLLLLGGLVAAFHFGAFMGRPGGFDD